MPTDVEEILRSRTVPELRPLPYATVEDDVRRRAACRHRRRRRRHRGVVLAGTVFVLLAAALGAFDSDDGADDQVRTAATASPAPRPAATSPTPRTSPPGLTIELLQRRPVGPADGEQVVLTFDGPLPADPPDLVEDIKAEEGYGIAAPDVPGIVWTVQHETVGVCDATHWIDAAGSVDVLIPAGWLAPGFDPGTVRYETTGGKAPMCGPHEGYVQLSIWGGVHDAGDVTVTVGPDRRQLTVAIAAGG
jgi:hypothetical protein